MFNSTKLLFDLQQVNAIAHSISGCLDSETIAHQVTEALVDRFPCTFARLWLVESDQASLRLVSSSGLYTHTNGSFARVPMGAYKVGKIAQNRIPFLSNHLADEPWVKDREWAIANNIQGFAGYPLMAGDRVLGVLVTFSHDAMAPEFLEVLQVLCMTVGVALDAALQVDQASVNKGGLSCSAALSDQLAATLISTRIALVGTERSLPPSMAYGILRAAEVLNHCHCHYCRLIYDADRVTLEAIVGDTAAKDRQDHHQEDWTAAIQLGDHYALHPQLDDLSALAVWLGGRFTIQHSSQNQVTECLLTLPCPSCQRGPHVLIQSKFPIIQAALTQLTRSAGLSIHCPSHPVTDTILVTDQPHLVPAPYPVIWVSHHHSAPIPPQVQATVTLTIDVDQFKTLVHQVDQGDHLPSPTSEIPQPLSEREREVMSMLAQGLRDRDIAQQLYISESTVKFHIKNSLTKLKGKNRYQAVYEATQRRWI
ncbi:MAG: GAF domain-containing protein [Merismopedia sp. SIO2A8]|nr:GAF domain-containing protein [Merismopedia sp. SIO2A8]